MIGTFMIVMKSSSEAKCLKKQQQQLLLVIYKLLHQKVNIRHIIYTLCE